MVNIISVQARMQSGRLPGKVLAPITVPIRGTPNHEDRPMLQLMVERLRGGPAEVVIATTREPSDDPIAELAERIGCAYVRGPVDDLMARHLQAAELMDADAIGICGADDPLMDWRGFAACFARLIPPVRYVQTAGVPLGLHSFAVTRDALEEAVAECSDPLMRAETHPWFRAQGMRYCPTFVDEYRLTVDEQPDLDLHRAIFVALYEHNPRFRWEDVVAFLADRPDIALINRSVGQRFRFE